MIDDHYGDRQERAAPGLHGGIEKFLTSGHPVDRQVIADIGAGTGAWACRLLDLGAAHVHAVEWGKLEPTDKMSTYQRDLSDADWPKGIPPVDFVTCIEVVEHIENQASLLKGIRSLLPVGGQALLTTPNLHSIRVRLKLLLSGRLRQFDSQGDPTHFMPIFLDPFTKVCRRAGFEVDRVWSYPEVGEDTRIQVGIKGLVADRIGRLLGDRLRGDTLFILLTAV